MVASEDEINDRLEEKDSARSARRRKAANTVGHLARQHAALAGQVADLERELGEVLVAAGDVIDVPELADVIKVAASDLTRWREQSAKPARRKRHRSGTKKNPGGTAAQTAAAPRTVRPTAPAPAEPNTAEAGPTAAAASS